MKGIVMAQNLICVGCGKALQTFDDLAGKSVQCPACQAVMMVRAAIVAEQKIDGDKRELEQWYDECLRAAAQTPDTAEAFAAENSSNRQSIGEEASRRRQHFVRQPRSA